MKTIQEHLDILLANTDKFRCYYDEICYVLDGFENDYLITSEMEPSFDMQLDCVDILPALKDEDSSSLTVK